MIEYAQLLNDLSNNGLIRLNDFYSITVEERRLCLQGHMNTETSRGLARHLNAEFVFSVKDNWLQCDLVYNGSNIHITLT